MTRSGLQSTVGVIVAAPRRRLPARRVKKISALLATIDEVREAHLPEVLAIGSAGEPRNVLFVVVEPQEAIGRVRERLETELARLLRRREALEVWPVAAGHPLIATVRQAGCVVGWRD